MLGAARKRTKREIGEIQPSLARGKFIRVREGGR